LFFERGAAFSPSFPQLSGEYKFEFEIIAVIISTKLRNPHSSEYTQQTCSQMESLARIFVTRWKTTALSDRGV
jgi:hypothetical protein